MGWDGEGRGGEGIEGRFRSSNSRTRTTSNDKIEIIGCILVSYSYMYQSFLPSLLVAAK